MLMWITNLHMGGGPPASGGSPVDKLVGFIRNMGTLMLRR